MVFIEKFNIKNIDLRTVKRFSREMCEKYNVIPIRENSENIFLLSKDEEEIEEESLRFFMKKNIIFEGISQKNFEKIINMFFPFKGENLEEEIIFKAIKDNANDIHFEPKSDWVDIRYRINGSLVLVYKISSEDYVKIVSKIKIMGKMDIAEKRRPQDGKMVINYNDKKYDLRISTIPVIHGEKIVIRILYCDSFNYTLEELGFGEEKIDSIRKMISCKNGMVIVCGPTGSGKTSTLYTILKESDTEGMNITTLEDPVEIEMININQMSLNKKLDITFANGLKSLLRQDPDIIMVGEIRDEETAQISVNASITGHKVYSTLHCKSPEEVFMRLENMGVKEYMIKESLIGVISQRLIKILCKKCKSVDENTRFKDYKIYKKCGCKYCGFTGYEGRKVVSSVCYYNSGFGEKNINKKLYDSSNKAMKEDLERLLVNGMISYEDYDEFIRGERLNEEEYV